MLVLRLHFPVFLCVFVYLFVIYQETPAHGMMAPTFEVCLPFLVKPLRKYPNRHTYGCVS